MSLPRHQRERSLWTGYGREKEKPMGLFDSRSSTNLLAVSLFSFVSSTWHRETFWTACVYPWSALNRICIQFCMCVCVLSKINVTEILSCMIDLYVSNMISQLKYRIKLINSSNREDERSLNKNLHGIITLEIIDHILYMYIYILTFNK